MEHIGSVYSALDRHAAHRLSEDYAADGSLHLTVSVVEASADPLATLLRDSTAGRVTADPVPS